MSLLTLTRSPTLDVDPDERTSEDEGKEDKNDEEEDIFDESSISTPKRHPKLARLRSPSFEGYFASRSGAFALQNGNLHSKINAEKIGEIQLHLQHMVSLLRDVDVLRMAVRVESRNPTKKRYLIVVSSEEDHSAVIGIDWTNADGPTIGLVLPIWTSTVIKLDGDGGFQVSRTLTRNHIFKPVSVQTLWSAKQVIIKAKDYAWKHKYFEGVDTKGFLEYYENMILSDVMSIAEWNEMDDLTSHVMEHMSTEIEDEKTENMKKIITNKLREVMRKLDLDEVSCRQIRLICEKELMMNLKDYRTYIDEQMLVVMGQMDSATQILDFLYLGSEWNASDVVELKGLGVGYILNITREVDNFFPQSFTYYNIRVFDEEDTELLKHWDHTYRFIEKAREVGSKVLVHCRHGISRSASTVIAYIMKKKGWTMSDTLEHVKGLRSIVQPNPGFQKQLIVYEGILNSSRNRFSSLFHQRTLKQIETTQPTNRPLVSQRSLSEKRKLFGNSKVSNDEADGADEHKKVKQNKAEDLVKEDLLVDANRETFRAPLRAEISFAEELEVDTVRQYWSSPGPQKGRLLRAKTMASGAVFIDEDECSDSMSNTVNSDDESSELTDAEDALMQQAVMATHMKKELMKSVQNLNLQPVERSGESSIEENNVRPSILRRLSHGSALMHLQNIANMKKRKSLNDKFKETITEDDEVDPDTSSIKKNTVFQLSEMFMRRSKEHVRHNSRRRTLDDEQYRELKELSESIRAYEGKDQEAITEIPEKNVRLELAAITEKVLPETKPQYPRYRHYGTMNRSVSLKMWRHFERQRSVSDDGDNFGNTSVDALNLEPGDFITTSEYSQSKINDEEEPCVADLVHLHDKIIREKVLKRNNSTPLSTSPGKSFEDGISELPDNTAEEESNMEKIYDILVRGKLKGVETSNSNYVKRVRSLPRMKRGVTLDDDMNTPRPLMSPRDPDECKSLPSSPSSERKTREIDASFDNSPLQDVKALVDSYEYRKSSFENEKRMLLLLRKTKKEKDEQLGNKDDNGSDNVSID